MDRFGERWIRLYREMSADEATWTWQARAIWPWLLVMADESGYIETRRGVDAIAAWSRFPRDVVEEGLADLIENRRASMSDDGVSIDMSDQVIASARSATPMRVETYVVQRGADGPVKIGRSSRFDFRLKELQTGSAEPLVVLRRADGDYEKRLHDECKAYRAGGEWFRPEPGLFDAIRRVLGRRR